MSSIRDTLRRIRVDAQALQTTLKRLDAADDAFWNDIDSRKRVWTHEAAEIDARLVSVSEQIDRGEAGADIGDEVEKIRNAWVEVKEGWASFDRNLSARPDQTQRKPQLTAIGEFLTVMVKSIAILTIPDRLRIFMQGQPPGGVVNFHDAFKDELPEKSDRMDLLDYLGDSTNRTYGLIDPATGNVWAISPDASRRWWSYYVALAIVGLGGLLAWFSPVLAAAAGLTGVSLDRENVLTTYVLVLLGVVLHIGVDLYKDSKRQNERRWTAVDELVLWGHAHELEVYITALGVWAGTFILVAVFGPVGALTAFLGGYSLDSLLDAGMARLEPIVEKGTTDLTAKLKTQEAKE
jgi:hypothetical protein